MKGGGELGMARKGSPGLARFTSFRHRLVHRGIEARAIAAIRPVRLPPVPPFRQACPWLGGQAPQFRVAVQHAAQGEMIGRNHLLQWIAHGVEHEEAPEPCAIRDAEQMQRQRRAQNGWSTGSESSIAPVRVSI